MYTDENVYWLEIGDQPGLRMAQINGAHQPGIAVADAYTETARYETAERVYLIHFTEEDIFFSRRIQTVSFPYTVTFPVTLTALAAGSFNAVVRGDVVARAASTSSPDHHTRITMNNSPQVVEDAAWDAYNTPVRHVFEGTVSQSALQEGANLLNLGIYRAALSREDLYFNWYEVEYARRFQADRDQLAFRASGGPGRQGYTVSGFSAGDLWVLDVTVPSTPTLVTNALVAAGQSYTVTFDVTQQAGGRFFVAADGALKSPVSITPYTPPDLLAASPGANYLIITHSDFITAAQRLADYRRDGTLTPRVVDVTDVYNLFADGIQHPLAIKNFLRYAYNNWTVRPEYVILVGDGHWNPRRYPIVQGNGQPFGWRPVTMLPYMALVDPWQGIVDSANLLATVAGDDILPDVLISRMIVTSNAELEGIVDKIIAYESASLPPEQQRLIFVADDPDTAGDFPTEAEKVIAGIPSRYPIDRFYLPNYLGQPGCGASDTACLPIKEDIITHTLNISGALFLNYLGHGDFPSWSAPQTMYYNDVAAFRNPQPLPVSVDMTCLTGYWFWPAQPDDVVNLSLAVRMLRQPIYGTVSGYAPTGLGLGMAHQVLHKAFYRAVYRDELGLLGPATQASKLALYQEGAYYDLIHTFTLFGDPALKLAVPLHRPGLTANGAITQTVTPGVTVQYDLTVANLGTEADTYTITALAEGSLGGEAWPAALSAVQVGPLAPGEQQALTVLVTVPQDALQFSAQDVQIAVVSQLNPLQQAAQSLHTEVLIRYGLAVNPLHDERIGIPGYTVNYPVAVTNTGNTPASFDVEIVSGWPVNLDPAPPLQLAVNETRAALVEIEIPPETPLGSQNITVLQITPRGAASIQETVVLTTIVQAEIAVQLAPLIAYGAGKPGSSVLFPLTITNTGNYTDVFELTAAGWPVSFSPSTTATLVLATRLLCRQMFMFCAPTRWETYCPGA